MRILMPIVGALLLAFCTHAPAQQLDERGCVQMAVWGGDVVWARDMGADRTKVRAFLESNKHDTEHFKVLLPIFDQLWETKVDRQAVVRGLYRECIARRGKYGTDT